MKKTFVWHPILLGLFPTLFLYSRNQSEYPISVVFVPLATTVAAAVGLWILVRLALRSTIKAALVVSALLVLFFSYGHVYDVVWYFFLVEPFHFGAESVLNSLFSILFLAGVFFIVRARGELSGWTRFANVASIILAGISAVTIIFGLIAGKGYTDRGDRAPAATTAQASAGSPDIYYIILDGFGREDILRDIYQYPQSALYDYLRQKGFYVAERSGSNYCQTLLSLSSSLNFKYLDPETDGYDPNSEDRTPLRQMMTNSRISEYLRGAGYTTVAFASGYQVTEIRTADIYLQPVANIWFLDEFQSGLLNTTPVPFVMPNMARIPLFGGGLSHPQANAHREMILRTMELLGEMPRRKSPKFVFAHLLAPHPPFLFRSDGSPRNPRGVFNLADGNALIGKYIQDRSDYIRLYRDQLIFVEQKAIEMIEAILANSATPPIIVVQADHGPGAYMDWYSSDNTNMRERLGILNAYYLPDGGETMLYDTITPVNTFRAILSFYFGEDLELLPDESYYSMWSTPYLFVRATSKVQRLPAAPPAP